MARPIIIDTDPGIDDAVALLLALGSPEIDVLGIVAVAGNLPLAATARNARALVELAGRPDIAVYAGCPRPIGGAAPDAIDSHGEGGLGGLELPPPAEPPQSRHGVVWLVERLREAAPGAITLCALGPLTDLAAALVMAPEVAAAVGELVLMGGGSRGNVTAAAEFNMHCDPVAASIVFDSGMPITMVPLDLTERVRGTPERIAPIAALGGRCAAAAATLLGPRRALGRPPMAMHDACVIAWLLAPELFRGAPAHVAVETEGGLTRGMTVIDRRGRGARPANATVLEWADADGIFGLLTDRLARLP